jgi:hypothetical protein
MDEGGDNCEGKEELASSSEAEVGSEAVRIESWLFAHVGNNERISDEIAHLEDRMDYSSDILPIWMSNHSEEVMAADEIKTGTNSPTSRTSPLALYPSPSA